MRRSSSSIIMLTFFAAVVYCALRYVASFSANQGVVLTALALLFYQMIASLKGRKSHFIPFSVFIKPKLLPILTDFELMKDTEEAWAELRTGIAKLPMAQGNVWDSGFAFSFISPDLIYKNASNSFATELDMYASLEPIAIGSEGGAVIWHKPQEFVLHSPYIPNLVLKCAGSGNDATIRIEILDKHWERLKDKEAFRGISKTNVRVDQMCGTVEVVLSVISWEEFCVHFSVMPGDSGKAFKDAVRRRAETRNRYGWREKPQTDIYGNETKSDHSNVVEHKYCEVSHSAL
jgi:hypothetical protein